MRGSLAVLALGAVVAALAAPSSAVGPPPLDYWWWAPAPVSACTPEEYDHELTPGQSQTFECSLTDEDTHYHWTNGEYVGTQYPDTAWVWSASHDTLPEGWPGTCDISPLGGAETTIEYTAPDPMPEPPEPGIPGWVDHVTITAANQVVGMQKDADVEVVTLYFNRQVD